MIRQAVAVLAAVALLCSAVPLAYAQEDVVVNLGSTVALRLGQAVVIDSEGIIARFERVVEDSRCPADVVCVWQGQATIIISARVDGGDAQNLMLTVGDDQYPSASFGQYSVKLLELSPYPVSSEQIEPGDYIAALVVSKTSANSSGVFVRAASNDAAVVAGWNLEKNKGTLVKLTKSDDGIAREVYRFVPWAGECSEQQGMECMGGRIIQEEFRFGVSGISAEVVGDELVLVIGGGISTVHILDIREMRTYGQPS